MKKKINLKDLSVKSFVTSDTKQVKGGRAAASDGDSTGGLCCDIASVIDGSCQFGPGCGSQWPNCA